MHSTDKYIHYTFILLLILIFLSIFAYGLLLCIQQHRKRIFDPLDTPSTTDLTSEITPSYASTRLIK